MAFVSSDQTQSHPKLSPPLSKAVDVEDRHHSPVVHLGYERLRRPRESEGGRVRERERKREGVREEKRERKGEGEGERGRGIGTIPLSCIRGIGAKQSDSVPPEASVDVWVTRGSKKIVPTSSSPLYLSILLLYTSRCKPARSWNFISEPDRIFGVSQGF